MLLDLVRFAHLLTFVAVLCFESVLAFGRLSSAHGEVTLRAFARIALIMLLPTGYTLARALGLASVPQPVFVALWVITGVWIVLVIATHLTRGRGRAMLYRADVAWSIVLTFGLCWDAWQGLQGEGHVLAPWLALKFAVLAVLIALRLWPRSPRLLFVAAALCAAWLGTARPEIRSLSSPQENRHGSTSGTGDPTQAHGDLRSRSKALGRVLS